MEVTESKWCLQITLAGHLEKTSWSKMSRGETVTEGQRESVYKSRSPRAGDDVISPSSMSPGLLSHLPAKRRREH